MDQIGAINDDDVFGKVYLEFYQKKALATIFSSEMMDYCNIDCQKPISKIITIGSKKKKA